MGKIKVWLLLLYLKLYDATGTRLRNEFKPFMKDIEIKLEQKGLEV